MKSTITIKDVAKKAGVSISTVSRVINDSKPVTDEVKQKVLDVIKETGYIPNPLARSLVTKRSQLIGVILPEVSDSFVNDVLNGITVNTVAGTQILQVSYQSKSPSIAKNMLESVTNEFITKAQELVPNGNVKILERVELPKNPVAPNKKMNIAIAFILGMMVGFGIVFLLEYLDNTYKNKEQLEKDLDIPVLGVIPMSDLD